MPVWETELQSVKDAIIEIYYGLGGAYHTFYTEWTIPAPAPDGGLGRTRANPSPMTFYGMTPAIGALYARAVTLACDNGTYADLVSVLVWLQAHCPEQGRSLYFSNTILGNTAITAEHKTKCAYAYIAGAIQSRFGIDVIADTDNGDVGVIQEKLTARIPELSCKALPLLAAFRAVVYPARYNNRAARNDAAVAASPWLNFARTIMAPATAMTADDLVYFIINEELSQAEAAAWARRGPVVAAFAAARAGSE